MPAHREVLRSRSVRVAIVLAIVCMGLLGWGLSLLRMHELKSEFRVLASLASAMSMQADATLEAADTALRATRAELEQSLIEPGSPRSVELLQSRVSSMTPFQALVVFDEHGNRIATSRPGSPPPPNASDRDFFVAARDGSEPGVYIGHRFRSRIDGQESVSLSMGWHDASGKFRGVVVLVAKPGFLAGDFARIAPAPDAQLALYRRDGRILAASPDDGVGPGLPAELVASAWDHEPPRHLQLDDGRHVMLAVHRLRNLPLVLVVTRDAAQVLQAWRQQSAIALGSVALAMLVIVALAWRQAREQWLRQCSQAALATEQERALRAFNAAREGHWEWDVGSGAVRLSPRMKELCGFDRDMPLARAAELQAGVPIHPDDRARLERELGDRLPGRRGSDTLDLTFRVRHPDGQWHHVRARGTVEREPDGRARVVCGAASDVTHEVEANAHSRHLELQLQQAHKLESLGRLAGGIAHDFNNVLAAVIGYAELARTGASDGSALARQLDQVTQAGLRGKALADRILAFSRGGGVRPFAPLHLQPVVDEVLDLLGATCPADVRVVRRLQALPLWIRGDATLLYEATMNLCTNAVQSMPAGGEIEVALDRFDCTEPRTLWQDTLTPGAYARLAVRDHGPGIGPDVITRLFEPFFTTKGPREGTGLGLAVVHGVVGDLGGAIDVNTRLGAGSTFTLYFPLVAPARETEVEDVDEVPLGQGQCVMVVDDERALVELAEETLAGLGYEPVGYASAADALQALRADPQRFDLVLTDERMPGMTGLELVREIRRLRKDLPIVLASGFGGEHCSARAGDAGVTEMLQKPLSRAELARVLARCVAATA